MKIKFIYPKFDKFLENYPILGEMPAIAAAWSFKMPPAMGIPIMAGLTPEHIEWDIEDQNVQEINYDDNSDLIAISYFTPQASYAYEIGDRFMQKGKTVIIGGMHPSMLPAEASIHCNSICIGEVDGLWSEIINDFQSGRLKPVYKACRLPTDIEIKGPKPGVFASNDYDWNASLVSISRGCPYACSWCNIPLYQGPEVRFRPTDIVAEEISHLSGQHFYIIDDVATLNREKIQKYMIELCDRIKDYNVKMFLSGSPAMNRHTRFLDAIARAGAQNIYVVFGSDTISKMLYAGNRLVWEKCIDLVRSVEDRGMCFFASFSLGFDFAGEEQFHRVWEFCESAKIKTAEFFIATPFPNTPFWNLLKGESRLILPVNWKRFNSANVVFRPKLISEDKLLEGFLNLWKEFYKSKDRLETFVSLYNKDKKKKAENTVKKEQQHV